jgi:PTH1 family peptidyl-tRNA hydrolase
MNASGKSVKKVFDFYQLSPADLLVVCDDLNLPLGKIRLRRSGSSGGQKGLEDIIRNLGTQDFARLRIGIDAPPAGRDVAAYVLSRFGKGELPVIESALQTAAQAVEVWVHEGIGAAMNRYNSAASDTN